MTHHDFDLSAALEQLRSDESGDLVRQMVSFPYHALIDAEATEVVQAERHERTLARTTQRNGSRPRLLTTRNLSSQGSRAIAHISISAHSSSRSSQKINQSPS